MSAFRKICDLINSAATKSVRTNPATSRASIFTSTEFLMSRNGPPPPRALASDGLERGSDGAGSPEQERPV